VCSGWDLESGGDKCNISVTRSPEDSSGKISTSDVPVGIYKQFNQCDLVPVGSEIDISRT
jgi:hypothetical protein